MTSRLTSSTFGLDLGPARLRGSHSQPGLGLLAGNEFWHFFPPARGSIMPLELLLNDFFQSLVKKKRVLKPMIHDDHACNEFQVNLSKL
ncbi:unnamed protein product [Prunus armeniaca]